MRQAVPEDLARRHRFDGTALDVEISRQGNFTLALVYSSFHTRPLSFGIAKRNVNDPERPDAAARLAIARALRRLR